MAPGCTILVGEIGGLVWVRVQGRGTFQCSPALKELADRMLARGAGPLVVDLQDCPMMDSTFMGTLTGIALGLRARRTGDALHVLNANPRNIELLESLGIDQILGLDKDGSAFPEWRREVGAEMLACAGTGALGQAEQAAHVLEAHEVLAGISQDNRRRFQDVVSYLREEVERTLPGGGTGGGPAAPGRPAP